MLKLNNNVVERKQFPNGETLIDLDTEVINGVNRIDLKYEDDKDLISLIYITDYIKEKGFEVELYIPYIPYSRMDRKENNRLFTLKSVAKLINNLEFKRVYVKEPHSDVSTALIDRVEVEETTVELTYKLLRDLLGDKKWEYSKCKLLEEAEKEGIYLVYPDAGASKRYGKQFKYPNIIECNKERDFDTGWITKLEISNNVEVEKVKKAIIVDDLSSKGGTFKLVGKMLKGKGIKEVYLVVTHCEDTIFEGELLTTDTIDKIMTTDSILTKRHEKIMIEAV